ncbi:hypothetical protein [Lentilactobacillus kosonis]|uniref:Acetyl-CoA carboxylase n=1 Tax=Lentilactobacillus kosonis TaxID=2810561 RepID=A0A401FPS0_9LACO|nr:hypothetical protein [Lentilactobacillus kosonis]GAY74306.1 hypothetical protein NBRC111893_2452 [Lentilactobacillus kosonis]
MTDSKYEAKLIANKIGPLFKNLRGDRYQIQIVNDNQAKEYTFFFMRQPKNGSMLISPIYQIKEYNLENLEAVLDELNHYYQFTKLYRGFVGELWPSNGNPIQKNKTSEEL